ncbi:hypothetical protein KDE13_07865 [Campylobacter sp. faydin G-140]|uniref:hypothetical protein n=1 Tax=Campylobacter anatolicus TaxID=2829105 RepID=UPI001B8EFB09|nr:hypothetical protein [Campylobacter anatolicus]MBR8466251.1 hypothetical protein [Campylobacter anatolicus]
MKLSKIYANSEIFKPIIFNDDMNFILSGDHSVGKSTLFALIDFCLLKKDKGVFDRENFRNFIFYLELKSKDCYITIKRPTQGRANIGIKITQAPELLSDCDNFDKIGGINTIKEYLDSILNFKVDNFRRYLSYFLRDQDNQSDIFRLNKFLKDKDINFKPIVANLLSIEGKNIKEKYDIENDIKKTEQEIILLEEDLGDYTTKEQIEAELVIYERRLKEKDGMYEKFDFYLSEKNISKELVDKIETDTSVLNKRRNSIMREIAYIDEFIKQDIVIKEDDLEALFKEMEVLFPKELRKNYQNVIDFNKQLAEERAKTFSENKIKFEKDLEHIDSSLMELNKKRMQILSVLENTDSMDKFKKLQEEITNLKIEIGLHNNRLNKFNLIDNKKAEIVSQKNSLNLVIERNKELVKTSFIKQIQEKISEYSAIVFGKDAAFSVGFNKEDNIEFDLKIAGEKGFDNDLEKGKTIKKLLCFIFSAALLEMYKNDNFFHFLAFDSPFDGDKNEWQKGTFEAIKKLSNQGLQVIITSIDDVIAPVLDMKEIESKTIKFLSEKDKLLGSF